MKGQPTRPARLRLRPACRRPVRIGLLALAAGTGLVQAATGAPPEAGAAALALGDLASSPLGDLATSPFGDWIAGQRAALTAGPLAEGGRLEPVRQAIALWQAWRQDAPLLSVLGFVLLFAGLSALSLPGCAVLALLAGSAYGLLNGTLLVGLGSTLGAVGPFLVARHLARGPVQRRLGHRLAGLQARLDRGGGWGLFWLRLIPVVPYPLLNPLLGLTRITLPGFLLPSLAGLTLASLPYVAAGGSLGAWWRGEAGSAGHIALMLALVLALAAAWAWQRQRQAGQPEPREAGPAGQRCGQRDGARGPD